jgi:outer membrane protein assembly factor BamD (BamD/ComL family)
LLDECSKFNTGIYTDYYESNIKKAVDIINRYNLTDETSNNIEFITLAKKEIRYFNSAYNTYHDKGKIFKELDIANSFITSILKCM